MRPNISLVPLCLLSVAAWTLLASPTSLSKETPPEAAAETVEVSVADLIVAAKTGESKALLLLGDYHMYGHKGTRVGDPVFKEGYACWAGAAFAGLAEAQCRIGSLYWRGIGVDWNPYTAAKWFEMAAAQGHPIAQGELSIAYFGGLGVPQDLQKSYQLARESAEQGWTPCQITVGVKLWNGRGVKRNRREACTWFLVVDLGPDSDDPSLEANLDQCRELGPEEMKAAESSARQLRAAHPEWERQEFGCLAMRPLPKVIWIEAPDDLASLAACSSALGRETLDRLEKMRQKDSEVETQPFEMPQ